MNLLNSRLVKCSFYVLSIYFYKKIKKKKKKTKKFELKYCYVSRIKTRLGHDLMHYPQQIFIILQGSISILLNLSYH